MPILASLFQRWFNEKEPIFSLVKQPTFVLWGKGDRTHYHTDKSSILNYVPDAVMSELEGVGHFPELEEPRRFREILQGFLQAGTGIVVPLAELTRIEPHPCNPTESSID